MDPPRAKPSFTFRPGYGWPREAFPLLTVLMPRGDSAWRWGTGLPQTRLYAICIFKKVTRDNSRTPGILLNIYYLKAGAEGARGTGRSGAVLLNQSIMPCKSTGGLFWQWQLRHHIYLAPGEAAWPRAELPSRWQLRCGNSWVELLFPWCFCFFSPPPLPQMGALSPPLCSNCELCRASEH